MCEIYENNIYIYIYIYIYYFHNIYLHINSIVAKASARACLIFRCF